jgi:phosphoglycolate phosphatase-like HAD superfamily hydrolase
MNVVFFDIDGTLLLSGQAGKTAMLMGLQRRFNLDNVVDGVPMSGRTDRAIFVDLLRAHRLPASDETIAALKSAYLECLPECLAGRTGRVLPGIRELVERLTERPDVSIGLLTGNTRRGAQLKLSHYQLAAYFRYGGFGDDHLDRESVARDAATAADDHHGWSIPRDRIWVIGDTPLDVGCARAIGARAVAVATGNTPRHELEKLGPDLAVDDFADPTPFLSLLDG